MNDVVGDVLAWVGSSESVGGGVALAGTVFLCLAVGFLASRRSRSHW
ncbi:hypothetical protein [Microbacterium sp.]